MKRRRPFAIAILFLCAHGSVAWGQTLTRGPYLQMGTTSAMTVRWRTSSKTSSVLQYGTGLGSLTSTAADETPKTDHEIRVTGLAADTTYYYSVGDGATTFAKGPDHFFSTAPTGVKPMRIWVLGDSGTAGSGQRAVRDAYYKFAGSSRTNIWLMLGDNAYNEGTDEEYQAAVFDMYPTMLRKAVLWPTPGNHDGHTADAETQTGPYYDIFTLPKSAEAGGIASGSEAYYSFDYGNVHFVCLESYETNRAPNGPMAEWLRHDLANNKKDWLIAFWHHPPYSKGSHDSDIDTELIEMRQAFVPILEEHGVDLVLCGHSHSYERSHFINGHHGSSDTFDKSMVVQPGSGRSDLTGAYTKTAVGPLPFAGAVYSVSGASGRLSEGSFDHPAMFISLHVLGSLVLDVNNNRLDVQYLDSTGARRDYFTMLKGDLDSTPSNVDVTNPPNGATFTAPVDIAIDATISDSDSTVPTVDFYAGAILIGSDPTAPYGIVWKNAPVGTHSLTALETHVDRATGPSAPVSITVIKPGGAPRTVSFQDSVAGYTGTRDTYITSEAPTANHRTADTLVLNGDPDTATLIKWDLTAIPVGRKVTAVTLTFMVNDSSPIDYEFYSLKRDWAEATATWIEARSRVKWETAGADGAADRGTTVLGSMSASSKDHLQTITLNPEGLAQVQTWIDNPSSNYGLILLNSENSNDMKVHSREKSEITERPKITITYQ